MKNSNKPANKRLNSNTHSAKTATLGKLVSPVSRARTKQIVDDNGVGPSAPVPAPTSSTSVSADANGAVSSTPKFTKVRLCRVSGYGANRNNNARQAAPAQQFSQSLLASSAANSFVSPISVPVTQTHQNVNSTTSNLGMAVAAALTGGAGNGFSTSDFQSLGSPASVDGAKILGPPQIIMPAITVMGSFPELNAGTRPSTPEPEVFCYDYDLVSGDPSEQANISSQHTRSPSQEACASLPMVASLSGEIFSAPEAEARPPTPGPGPSFYYLGNIGSEVQSQEAGLSSTTPAGTQPLASTSQSVSSIDSVEGSAITDKAFSVHYAPDSSAWDSSIAGYPSNQSMLPEQDVQMDFQAPSSPARIAYHAHSGGESTDVWRDANSCVAMDVDMDPYDRPSDTLALPRSIERWNVSSSNLGIQDDFVHGTPLSIPVRQSEQPNYGLSSRFEANQYSSITNRSPSNFDSSSTPNCSLNNQTYCGTQDVFHATMMTAPNTTLSVFDLNQPIPRQNDHQISNASLLVFPSQPSVPGLGSADHSQISYALPSSYIPQVHPMTYEQQVDYPWQPFSMLASQPHPATAVDVERTNEVPRYQRSAAPIAEPSSIKLCTQSNWVQSIPTLTSSETDARAHRLLYGALPDIKPAPPRFDFGIETGQGALDIAKSGSAWSLSARSPSMTFRAPDADITVRHLMDRPGRSIRGSTTSTSQLAKRSRKFMSANDEGPHKRRRVLEDSVTPRIGFTSTIVPRPPKKARHRSSRTCSEFIGRLMQQMRRTWR